ncbi:MAG: 8-oxo-dGTP diphosphatase MutT [Gammaproteobacteria bacterium]|nr:8-oxo-dGTP diphosphatase MutT [Gammaproteobacteria bacterium]
MLNTVPELHVACAVIRRDHHLLLSRRLDSAHQGGLWEFPGGKVERDETPTQALARELREELGIAVLTSRFRFQIPWDYGDRVVRLWVFDVDAFHGEPQGLEGQRVRWVPDAALTDYDFPEANTAIVETLSLPRVARFYDPSLGCPERWLMAWKPPALLYFRGLTVVSEVEALLTRALTLGHHVILPLDQHHLWRDGVGLHRRKHDPRALATKALAHCPGAWPLTAGCRSLQDWRAQADWPAHAWFVSPVLPTKSHPALEPLGWGTFTEIARQTARPCYALGGVTPDHLAQTQLAEGFGVAGIRGFQ